MNIIDDSTEVQPNRKYKQLKISAAPTIVIAFKSACAAKNVSMASVLSNFMTDFSNIVIERNMATDYSTRKRRRTAIQVIIRQLEQVKASEEEYRDRIPENLQNSIVYDRADELVSTLDEVIDILSQS